MRENIYSTSKPSNSFYWPVLLLIGLSCFGFLRSSALLAEEHVARWRSPESKMIKSNSMIRDKDSEDSDAELSEEEDSESKTTQISGMPAPKPGQKKSGDKLVVSYIEPADKDYHELAKVLQESKGIDNIVEAVNEKYDYPHLDVVFDMCGEANAFYDSSTRRIILCYELVAALSDGFRKDLDLTDEEVGKQVIASLIFTFFHELGHASIDVFDLPLTGNEEDAADRFATLILLSGDKDDENDLADNAIGAFDLNTAESLEDLDFADEHPVDDQRWFTMACLMVGSNPEKYNYLVGDNGLPEERSDACQVEYTKISSSWDRLMGPHLRNA